MATVEGAAGIPVLSIRDLQVSFDTAEGVVHAVDGISLDVHENEVLGLVGESGSGKTVSMLAVLGLLPTTARISGHVLFGDVDLLQLGDRELGHRRGRQLAIVVQDALGALNPVQRVGDQIAEAVTTHERRMPRGQVHERVVELLKLVDIPDPRARARDYPHELSGGMRQRVVIAIALANNPAVLIADEPTTALDATIQAQILDVIRRIQHRTRTAIILVTHDLASVAGLADRVAVMYAGRLVEAAAVRRLFAAPAHPYTRALLASLPRLEWRSPPVRLAGIDGQPVSLIAVPSGCPFHPRCSQVRSPEPCATVVPNLRRVEDDRASSDHVAACHFAGEVERTAADPPAPRPASGGGSPGSPPAVVVEVDNLVKHFGAPRRAPVHAVCGVSFALTRGETLGLVGESGCGKTTTARLVLNLLPPTSGTVRFEGEDLAATTDRKMRAIRRRMQVVFQNPYASLNPRRSVGSIVSAPLRVHGLYRDGGRRRVDELLAMTGLDAGHANRFPNELSGGQRQRVSIARALSLEPALIVLDEPVSALDVSVRAGIVNLLQDLQDRLGLTYLLIAHDLAVIGHLAHRVAVMYLGKIVEVGSRDEVVGRPSHPYTQALLSAVPIPDPDRERARRRVVLTGELPSPISPPSGCRFRTRCWKAEDVCSHEEPILVERGQGHPVACHFAEAAEVVQL